MDKILRSKLVRKALALVLALVVGLTFVPLLGSNAYAADADQADDISDGGTESRCDKRNECQEIQGTENAAFTAEGFGSKAGNRDAGDDSADDGHSL